MTADVAVENHGTLFLLRPFTEADREWVAEHIDREETQFFGSAVVVEPRYVEDIVNGMITDGLVVA